MNAKIFATKEFCCAESIGGEVLRSSNLKYSADTTYLKHCAKKEKFFKRTGTLVFAIIVAVSIVVIPCTTLAFNVYAVTDDSKEETAVVSATEETQIATAKKAVKKKPTQPATTETTEPETVPETTVAIEQETVVETVEETQPTTTEPASDYAPSHIELSAYDRDKLERLVTGEAGSLGYEGCALVAQAIRDSMILSGTNSIDKIITEYQYTGSTEVEATEDAKKAVAFIFDQDGYAVNHRILYFYATDLVEDAWHESQKYIVSCGNMKFFDQWV